MVLFLQTCPGQCEVNKPCVECVGFKSGEYDEAKCEASCAHVKTVDEIQSEHKMSLCYIIIDIYFSIVCGNYVLHLWWKFVLHTSV